MSSSSQSPSRVAHVEDADEDSSNSVGGNPHTRKYATSEALKSPSKANTSRSRADKRPVNSRSSSASVSFNESDPRRGTDKKGKPLSRRQSKVDRGDAMQRDQDRERQRRDRRLKESEEGRRAAAAAAAKEEEARPLRKQRPTSMKHSNTQPVVNQLYRRGHVDNPASYGVQQPAISTGRPRAQTRPASYYAGQPRPSVNMAWPASHQRPAPFPVGTFPPPHMWQSLGASGGGFAPPPPPSPVGHAPGFFDNAIAANPQQHLRQRFEARPASAMGFHKLPPPPAPIDYYGHEDLSDDPTPTAPLSRRPSRSRRAEDDRRRMPPPERIPLRPQSAIPPSTPFRAPMQRPPSRQSHSRPPPVQRRSVGFVEPNEYDDTDLSGGEGLFHDISPNSSYRDRRAMVPRSRRDSRAYDNHEYDLVPASHHRRRSSMYGSTGIPSSGVSVDEKYSSALKYQEAVSGGPQMPLTAETLRKAGKRGAVASSRSTRSSGSHDDSEYRRSNATGITGTTYNSEDFTIKVSGGARVRVPGAEIECDDGGEITFSTRPTGSRSDGDRASMIYPQLEDARSRMERKALPHRPRAPSQSDSQSRGYAPNHAPYDFPGSYF
ncbi:hypothetical protein QQS21_003996 [Conoideocrella luteorostrata]|uniref:Uncharacterized protein n=1 Tax=Conoideocrella luteorostrata TaxID=1105319 RepID=A0AAJ0CS69_9HYPO|nr:hypothetical protein QQS21_003996 [Conoideocrella luteorostrata]